MWAQAICAVLGLWLLAAPAILGYGGPPGINDRIVGLLVTGVALIALWPPARSLRWLNVLHGLWLFAAPWLLLYQGRDLGLATMLNDVAIGGLLLCLAPVGRSERSAPGRGWLDRWERRRVDRPSDAQ